MLYGIPASDSAEESTDSHSLPPVLFCNQQDSSDLQIPLGACEFWEEDDTKFSPGSSMVPVRVFSPVMKSLVQIAIWNSVSFWLVLVMIANTLTYNGFMSHNITTDSITRLFLVGVYAAANAGHQCRTTILLYRNFTSVLFQTCWIFICREFIFLDRKLYKDNCKWFNSNDEDQVLFIDMDSRSFIFRLFGMTERSDTYQVPEKSEREIARAGAEKPEEFSPDDEDERYYLMAQKKEESKFDQCVKPSREAEIKAYEKAADAALEKTLANVAVLLGICLSTALAPWASTEKIDATSAQLGSYALLLSVSTGLTALVGSISQLTNTVYSARMLLLFQEKTITANNETHRDEVKANQFSLRDDVDFGFSKSIDGQSQLTWYGLWRSTSSLGQLPWLLFGSALMLIPNFHRNGKTGRSCEDCRHCKTCRNSGKWLCFTVHGVNFTCETYTWYPSVESGSRKEVATSVRPVSADNGVFADNVVSANSGGLANSGTQQKKRVGKVAQQLKPPLPLIPW
ncbi:hypothetical protein GJ744_003633 [Endocarpon pusillum]|uniref:Uncharacterized protein n=1 Tax=Endocarpon pusillum TaxID=364733 RepID=A0A8H7DZQ1_9EURO|nr:hypothetical protein GJ744_003633 [Endocarpon pusillum]